jgi:hypothetical protein
MDGTAFDPSRNGQEDGGGEESTRQIRPNGSVPDATGFCEGSYGINGEQDVPEPEPICGGAEGIGAVTVPDLQRIYEEIRTADPDFSIPRDDIEWL